MTVTQLIRRLEALKAKHGNIRVGIDSTDLLDGNGAFNIVNVHQAEVDWVALVDGDGSQEFTKSGLARGAYYIVMK